VYAPCNGRVQHVESSLRDNVMPSERIEEDRPATRSSFAVTTQDVDILLAHLQNGSVRMKIGEQIRVCTPVGAIGNSGNSTEPHLHMHAKRGRSPQPGLDGEGVPIAFSGRFLTRKCHHPSTIEVKRHSTLLLCRMSPLLCQALTPARKRP
jgi:hypothetical protein